jgi:lipopolysaccharide biosynthesis regulator YciM
VTLEQAHRLLWVAALLALAALGFAVSRHRRRRTEAKAYLKGVRSMLSDDPDAAIEALSGAARLGTPQARETYLALGALFRRTGDLSRAVRLHRNMLAGGLLVGAERLEVERELAEDYRRSGMLAEAVELLAPRAASDAGAAGALREVLADQGRWREAAATQSRLTGGAGPDPLRAQLLAAAARAELAQAREGASPAEAAAGALEAAEAALAAAPGCPAALLARAEALGAAGRAEEAVAALGEALRADPGLAVLAWSAVARQPDPAAALALLEQVAGERPGDAAVEMLRGRLLHRLGRRQEALDSLRRALTLDSSGVVTLALGDFLREVAPQPPGDDLRAHHELLVLALRHRALGVPCARCGAEAPAPAWRCRACGALGGQVVLS